MNVLRSWIRPANSDAKAATTSVVQTENDDRDGQMLLQPNRELPRPPEQHERRGDRHDAEIERQLLRVPQPVAEHGADVVRTVADDAVGAEQSAEGLSAQRPAANRTSAAAPARSDVEAPAARTRVEPASLDDRESRRCEDDAGCERDRLRAGRDGEPERHQHEQRGDATSDGRGRRRVVHMTTSASG